MKCGTKTIKGTPCSNGVSMLGSKCHIHSAKNRCIGITRKKEQCKGISCKGIKYCIVHKKQDPNYNAPTLCSVITYKRTPCTYEAKNNGLCTFHINLANREEITKKKCTICREIKPLESFYTNPRGKAGRESQCKECSKSAKRLSNYPRKVSGIKVCTTCKEEKNVSYFHSDKNITDGLKSSCIECLKSYNAEHKFQRQEEGEKFCIGCNLAKDVSSFWAKAYNSSGLGSTCRECRDIERVEKLTKLDNFISYICKNSRASAKRRKLDHGIDENIIMKLWQEAKQICIGTGYKMTHKIMSSDNNNSYRVQLPHYYNLSIDRINSNLGYVKDNIQLCTYGYNFIKGELDEEFLYIIAISISGYDKVSGKVKISSIVENFIKNRFNHTLSLLPYRTRNIKFDITLEDLYQKFEEQGGLCMLSGKTMTTFFTHRLRPLNGRKQRIEKNYFNISIDRIDSLKDYTFDNIQLVCSCVNMMKGEIPENMFLEFCKAIAKTHPII